MSAYPVYRQARDKIRSPSGSGGVREIVFHKRQRLHANSEGVWLLENNFSHS